MSWCAALNRVDRKRLEPNENDLVARDPEIQSSRGVFDVDGDNQSVVQIEVPPWAEDSKVLSDEGELDVGQFIVVGSNCHLQTKRDGLTLSLKTTIEEYDML